MANIIEPVLVIILEISVFYLVTKVFIKAMTFKLLQHLPAISTDGQFSFERSHYLVMDREKIDDMTEHSYIRPIDQYYSLENWKNRVSLYINDYRHYLKEKTRHSSNIRSLH